MKAELVALHLQAAGIRVAGWQEGDAVLDGVVRISPEVYVQVATIGRDCRVMRGRAGRERPYHFREDLAAIAIDVRDALFHCSDPDAVFLDPVDPPHYVETT